MPSLTFDALWRDRGAQKGLKGLGDEADKTRGRFTRLQSALSTAGGGIGKFAKGIDRDFGSVDRRLGGFVAGVGKLGGGIAKFAGAGAVALGATGVAAGVLGAKVVGAAGKFDKSMRLVGATTGTTGKGFKDLTKLALDMGAKTSFSAQGASDAMLELAKGGMTAAEIKAGALQSTLTLATAGGLELGDAAGYMVSGLTSFNLKAKDAARVAAALAGGANASTASVQEMGLAFSMASASASAAGLSIEETSAAIAALANNGLKGSDAGTSLKTMLSSLQPTSKTARDAMADLGLVTAKSGNKFFTAKGEIKSMTEISGLLADATKNLTNEEKTRLLRLAFGSDAQRAAIILAKEGATGLRDYTKATSDKAAADNLAKTATQGYAGALERFKGSVETASIQLGTKFLPSLTKILDYLSNKAIPALTQFGSDMMPAFRTGGQALTAFWHIGKATLGAFVTALTGGREGVKGFADFVSTHQADIVGTFVTWGRAAIEFGIGLGRVMSGGLRAFAGLADGVNVVVSGMIDQFGRILHAARMAFRWDPVMGPQLKAAEERFTAFADHARGDMGKTGDSARGLADRIDNDMIPALTASGKALEASGRKAVANARAADAVARAEIGHKHALDSATVAAKANGRTLDLNTQKGRENRAALNNLVTSSQAYISKLVETRASSKRVTAATKDAREEFIRVATRMGIGRQRAQELTNAYFKIPKKVQTPVTQPGMSKARGDTWDLDKRINNLNNKRVSVTFETNAKKFGLTSTELNAARRGMRAGGPVQNLSGRGRAGADTEPILGEVGEHMLTRADVRAMGGHNQVLDFRRALHMAAGGPVSRSIEASVGHLGPTPNFDRIGDIVARRVGNKIGKSLLPLLGGSGGLGPGAVGNPHGYARFHGGLFTKLAAANLRQAERFAGVAFRVMQGGWRPRTSYSGTSHAGDAVDTQNDARVIRAIRRVGWASGDRAGLGNWGAHAHSIPGPGRGYARGSAVWQWGDYVRRGGARQGLRSPWGLASGGILTARVAERGPERVLSARQTHSFERMVSAMDRGRGAGNTYYVTLNAPNYVGSRRELRDTVVDMIRLGQLQVARR